MDARTAKRMLMIQQWTAIIQDRFDSGLTVQDYCKKNGIVRSRFFYWQKIVREDAVSRATDPGFVEISLPGEKTGTELTEYMPEAGTNSGPSGELVLSVNGIDIHVTEDTSPALLARTIGVIRDAQ